MSYIDRAVKLARISLAFGRIERVTYHEDGRRLETDTDHTVMLSLIAIDLIDYATILGLDEGLVLQFALVHDLVEVYAGDQQTLTISLGEREEKALREKLALTRLNEELGPCRLTGLMREYEIGKKAEAQFIRVLDKVMPKLTHILNGCASAKKLVGYEEFAERHRDQRLELREKYPHVDEAVHDLLLDSMEEAQAAWDAATMQDGEESLRGVRGTYHTGVRADECRKAGDGPRWFAGDDQLVHGCTLPHSHGLGEACLCGCGSTFRREATDG